MYKKTFFTLLLFLAPITLFKQTYHVNSSQIISNKLVKIDNDNYHLIDKLFEANEEKKIEIKNYWEEDYLISQRLYCSYNEKYFHSP